MEIDRRAFSAGLLSIGAFPMFSAMAAEPRRGGTLIYAVLGVPPTLDCHAATSYATMHYVSPHYSTLLKLDGEPPKVVGDLADDWSISPDQKTYTFRLHPNVTFHDGSPLTSKDVAVSLERIKNPPEGVLSARKLRFAIIDSIETPDPATVVIKLTEPSASFLGTLAEPWNTIYSAKKLAEDPKFPEKTVMGSGPFVFQEYVPGSHWVGKRFDNYFRSPMPYLDGFRAVTMTSSAFINALQGEQVMAEFRTVTPAQRDRLVQGLGDKINIVEGPFGSGQVFMFNCERKPFDDIRVRRALNIAVDRWGAAKAMARTVGMPYVGTLQRPGSDWAPSEAEMLKMTGLGNDAAAAKAEAKKLLADAGVSNLKIKLLNRNVAVPYTSIGVYLIDQWRQIGVDTEHVQVDIGPLEKSLQDGEFDAAIDFLTILDDDPSLTLNKYRSADKTANNPARYIDRKIDALFDQQDQERDPVKRKAIVRELETYLCDQSYMVPFLWQIRIVAMWSYVKGWKFTHHHFLGQDLSEIWLDRQA
jgi:peptide/nickel transport system substrate-binding protein